MAKHIKSFRVYPERKTGWYYKVFLFPDKEGMYAFERIVREHSVMTEACRRETAKLGYDFVALTTSFNKPENDGRIGYMLFHRGWMGAGIVAHEMTHAALRYWEMRHRKIEYLGNGARSTQECFCETIERMNIAFWRGYYRKARKR